MKSKEWYNRNLDEINQIDERFEIRYKDPSIYRVDRYNYKFSVNSVDYLFNVLQISPDWYSVQFGVSSSKGLSIQRQHKHTITDTYEVINKVTTCLIYYIKDISPTRFEFSTSDTTLGKLYVMMIPKIQLFEPFFRYNIHSKSGRVWSYSFIKKDFINEGYRLSDYNDVITPITY